MSVQLFAYFMIRLFIFLTLSFKISLYILETNPWVCASQMCSTSLWLILSISSQYLFVFNLILFLLVPLGTSTRHEVLPWLPVTPSVLGSLMVMDPCCAWENHLSFLETLLGGTVRASQVVLVIKNPPADAGDEKDASSIPESGRSARGGHGYPVQYFCRENLMDRGAWRACKESMGLQRVRQG